MTWKHYLKALGAAASSGAVTAAVDAVQTEGETNPKALAVKASVGALLGMLFYLKQSPLSATPKPDTTPETKQDTPAQ